jgi:hypothetical protein
MDSGTRFLTFTSILMLALILQVVLAVADQRDTPEKAAVEFAEAYHWLDPSMADRLCSTLARGKTAAAVVEGYLQRTRDEARALGYEFDYMKQGIYHVQTRVTATGENTVEIRLSGDRRRTINPVYGLVARWFAVGEVHPVDETLTLVREGDSWKVCGKPFHLIGS